VPEPYGAVGLGLGSLKHSTGMPMKIKPQQIKILVIEGWCLAVGIFLWIYSLCLKPEMSFIQFYYFCIVLYGGGFAYHVAPMLV
jgi:hypothetical protein